MNICKYIKSQLELHSSMQPQDIIKLCYQAAFGAEHLLSDKKRALTYFNEEFANTEPSDGDLYDQISDNIYRINLGAWKSTNMPSEWLFEMFVNSMKPVENGKDLFLEYLNSFEKSQSLFIKILSILTLQNVKVIVYMLIISQIDI